MSSSDAREQHVARAEAIAAAVLYEGYMLYPYRPSSVKNQQRWTFGGVYPPAYSAAQAGTDPDCQQTQCLVSGSSQTSVDVSVRFLQLQKRDVMAFDGAYTAESEAHLVTSLKVGDRVYRTWEEAVERKMQLTGLMMRELLNQRRVMEFTFPSSQENEQLVEQGSAGVPSGIIVRRQSEIEVNIGIELEQIGARLFRLTLRISNVTPFADAAHRSRADALVQTLISTHAILSVHEGEFVSLIDPPDQFSQAASSCKNIGTYPVLVGEEGQRDMLLSSPIILYDYPQIAPESAGDLFDGTEIDEILSLRILTLTDEEKQEMRQADDRSRELLDRTESLPAEVFMRLHGALRGIRPTDMGAWSAWDTVSTDLQPAELDSEYKAVDHVNVGGVSLKKGSQVRLRPKRSADAFDMILNGRNATVESIEQDYENHILLAVTVDDDPGRDFGMDRKPAHRFFYAPDEVEPIGRGGIV